MLAPFTLPDNPIKPYKPPHTIKFGIKLYGQTAQRTAVSPHSAHLKSCYQFSMELNGYNGCHTMTLVD
jgi:hypothetical protein